MVSSISDDLGLFGGDVVGKAISVTYSAVFTRPDYIEYLDPSWAIDVCGYDCHIFGGYNLSQVSVYDDAWDNPSVVSSFWTPDDISATIKVDGRTFVFDDLGSHDNVFELYNGYPDDFSQLEYTGSDTLYLSAINSSFGVQAAFYRVNDLALGSINPSDPTEYAFMPGEGADGGVYWQFDDGSGMRSTSLQFRPWTFAIGPAATGAVPEPATWLMMFMGFAAIGASIRAKKIKVAVNYA